MERAGTTRRWREPGSDGAQIGLKARSGNESAKQHPSLTWRGFQSWERDSYTRSDKS